MSEATPVQQLAQIVVRGLAEGKAIEIDGLGIFYRSGMRVQLRTAHRAAGISGVRERRRGIGPATLRGAGKGGFQVPGWMCAS